MHGDFFEVRLSSLLLDTIVGFDLFLPPKTRGKPVLYRHRDLNFSEEARDRLIEHQVENVLVRLDQENFYHAYLETNVSRVVDNPDLAPRHKSDCLYAVSGDMIREFMCNPMAQGLIARTRHIANNMIRFLRSGADAFSAFLQSASPQYTTETHSVNVATYTLQLALRSGIEDDQLLQDIGIGAYLHDIGKCRVPSRILNKPDKLDPIEWRTMRKHPMWGCQILSLHGLWSPVAIAITRDHHEKLDGSGYPFRKRAADLPDYVRMTTISDVFDAISTTRAYKDGVPTFAALETMKTEMSGQLDQKLFANFVQMLRA